jgi:peptidoglycan/LPS O-acetylase OafA/YrhL
MVMWISIAGISHWFLDLLVHQPDLTLYGAPPKLGLSLWAYKWPEFALEIVIVLLGLGIYRRATEATSAAGRVALWTVGGLLVVAALVEKAMPPPPSVGQATLSALALYVVFSVCGLWLDRTRRATA